MHTPQTMIESGWNFTSILTGDAIVSKVLSSGMNAPSVAHQDQLPPTGSGIKTDVLENFHLMIVDDDEINNYLLVRRLESKFRSIMTTTAINGHDALLKLTQFALEDQWVFPHLILVDLDMPIFNGFDFLQQYFVEFFPMYPKTDICVLTSSDLESDREKVSEFPLVSRFITKPLPLSLLA